MAMDERIFELPHDTGFSLDRKDTENIVSQVNRALHSAGISDTRIERVRCMDTRRLLGVTTPTSTLRGLLKHHDMVLKAARTVDSGISDVIAQQKWMWIRVHNISVARYTGKEGGRGLRMLREELGAENSGVHIPAEIRWLGGGRSGPGFRRRRTAPPRWWPQFLAGRLQPPLLSWGQALWSPV